MTRRPLHVDCDEFKKLIGDYLDDEVADELCQRVKEHLAICGPCSVEVDTLQKTIFIYRRVESEDPGGALSPDARKRLFAALSYEYRNAGSSRS